MKSGQTEHAHIVAVNLRRGLEGNDRFVEQTRAILGGDTLEDGSRRMVFAVDAKEGQGVEDLVTRGLLVRRDTGGSRPV